MLTLSADPGCYLIELADLTRNPLPECVGTNLDYLVRTVNWARDYLCHPHAELGRKGPVCPYAQMSMDKGLFYLTVYRGQQIDEAQVYQIVMKYRDWFLDLEPRSGHLAQFKTILILFPDIATEDAPRIIDGIQIKLKPEYVSRGIMIGEFHPGPPQKSGLWNADFRPLYCPVPLLSIRFMVPTDFAFLKDEQQFVTAYLDRWGQQIPPHLRQLVHDARERFGLDLPAPGAEVTQGSDSGLQTD